MLTEGLKINQEQGIDITNVRQLSSMLIDGINISHQNPLDHPLLYQYLNGLSNSSRNQLFKRHLWLPGLYDLLLTRLNKKELTAVFHPGVLTRHNEFMVFITQLDNPDYYSTESLIQLFANTLGQITVFRLLAISQQEANKIQQDGIRAPALLNKERAISALTHLLFPQLIVENGQHQYSHSFANDAYHRLAGGDQLTLTFMSVSTSRDLAASVGWQDSPRNGIDGVEPFLFELRLPMIFTVSIADLLGSDRNPKRLQIGNRVINSVGLERLVPFYIAPQYITEVTQITRPPKYTILGR